MTCARTSLFAGLRGFEPWQAIHPLPALAGV